MNTTALKSGFFEHFRLMLGHPPRQQVAALCYRKGSEGPEILLVTSRQTKRWILPKGWPETDLSRRKTASLEAFEEAGVVGEVAREPIGEFLSHKGINAQFKVRTKVVVYPLRAEKQKKSFPERGKRELAWLSLEEAIGRCNEPGLKQILRSDALKSLLKAL